VLLQNLSRPIEHDPLKILEKIQAFDTEDEIEMSNLTSSQQQSALPTQLFDEIQRRYEELYNEKKDDSLNQSKESEDNKDRTSVTQEAAQVHHLAIFDAFNEALDLERPYQIKGLPNPWSKQTRVTNEKMTLEQVDAIVKKAMARVVDWDKNSAGTRFAPPPPPPPPHNEFDPPMSKPKETEEEKRAAEKQDEEERINALRSERLGMLLSKESHQREQDWLDYEVEDTQVRFDLADMILEELADEVTQFLMKKQKPNLDDYSGDKSGSDFVNSSL